LDEVRDALILGDTDRAISVLDEHEQRFKTGILTEEAEVLRIQALLKTGAHGPAKARADRYLRTHANSPHAKKVRGMIEAAEPGPVATNNAR
jgi:outer membrane protein assembly factor BamD (BamD/ComL family)